MPSATLAPGTAAAPPVSSPPAGADDAPLPLREKVAYGVGEISGIFPKMSEMYLFTPIFVVLLQVSPVLLGALGVLYRLWDAITDLLMGWVSDNTRTRWGRRRPYLVVGAILTALWMPLVWLVDPEWSPSAIVGWMVVSQLGLYLFATIWNIPYQCLLMELTKNSAERTTIASFRCLFGFIPWIVMGWVWYLAQLPIFGPGDGSPDILRGAFWVTGAAAVVVICTGVVPAFGCRERYYAAVSKQAKTRLRADLRLTLSSRPFLWLSAFAMFFWIGSQSCGGLAFFTRLYYVCEGDQQLAAKITGIEGTLTMTLGIVGLPLFTWIARKKGKRAALMLVAALVMSASLSTWFTYNPGRPYLSMVSGLLLAPTSAAIWALLPSLMGDVVDHDELRTAQRREGSFAAVFSWFFKVAMSASAGLAGVLVALAGYDEKASVQTPEAIHSMRVLLMVVPAAGLALALLALWRFPLSASRIAAQQSELQAARAARAAE